MNTALSLQIGALLTVVATSAWAVAAPETLGLLVLGLLALVGVRRRASKR
jgi:hypothetical protein